MSIKSLLLCGIAVAFAIGANAEWTAPANPDPEAIIHEARQDFRARRYADALAKHVWYHQHALEYRPSLYGARLVGVLTAWNRLAKVYPPALVKLKEVRDEAGKQVVESNGNVKNSFHDFESINSVLGEENLTVKLFKQFDTTAPVNAELVYDWAEQDLIVAKEFHLCGKYLNPRESVDKMLELYQLDLEFAAEQATPTEKHQEIEIAVQILQNRAATLIALLVLNDRKVDAEEVAKRVAAGCESLKNSKTIDASLKGRLPEQI